MQMYLRPGPYLRATAADERYYVFHYGDHLDYEEFNTKVPGSLVFGIGHVMGWNWHINQLGKKQPYNCRNYQLTDSEVTQTFDQTSCNSPISSITHLSSRHPRS